MERKEANLVDSIALREAVINAVVHNDYTREVPPLFEIFSDKIVITTYGGLVEGLSQDDFFNCCSMPRNRELMRVFHDLELVEHLGSSMTRIMHVYNSNIFTFTSNFMKITFPFDNGSKLGDKLGDSFEDFSSAHKQRSGLSNLRKRILELMEENSRISMPIIADKLGYSVTAIEKNVDFLKTNGYLKRVGNTKSGYWEVTE